MEFLKKLNKLTDEEKILTEIQEGFNAVEKLDGDKKISAIIKLLPFVKIYTPEKTDELIDKGIATSFNLDSKNSALLFSAKAFQCFANGKIAEADQYADRALEISRKILFDLGEAKAQVIKGYVFDVKGEHKKTMAWYTMASAKCSEDKKLKLGIMLDMATSLSKQGEYSESFSIMEKALLFAKEIIAEKQISKIEKLGRLHKLADIWSRLGVIHEVIGDNGGAVFAYEKSLILSRDNNFKDLSYKTYSKKTKMLLSQGKIDNARQCLEEAQNLLGDKASQTDARYFLFLSHDWARFYRLSKEYEKAMNEYHKILYSDDSSSTFPIGYLIENQQDMFNEVISGIIECLFQFKKNNLANRLSNIQNQYRQALEESGIYKEYDKNNRLQIHKENIITFLNQLFNEVPFSIKYQAISATLDQSRNKVLFKKGDKEFLASRRLFYVLKYLIDNADRYVSRQELKEFLSQQGEAVAEDTSNDGIRTYIYRLKKQFDLNFIFSRKEGWKLESYKPFHPRLYH